MSKLDLHDIQKLNHEINGFKPKVVHPKRTSGLYVYIKEYQPTMDPLSLALTIGVKVQPPDPNKEMIGDYHKMEWEHLPPLEFCIETVRGLLDRMNCLEDFDTLYVLNETKKAYDNALQKISYDRNDYDHSLDYIPYQLDPTVRPIREYTDRVDFNRLNEEIDHILDEAYGNLENRLQEQILRATMIPRSLIFTANPESDRAHWSRSAFLNGPREVIEPDGTVTLEDFRERVEEMRQSSVRPRRILNLEE